MSPCIISLILPTRGRVEKALTFITSALELADQPEHFEVILGVDDDDIASHGIAVEGVKISVVAGPRRSMGSLNSECADHSEGEILMLVNDDSVVRTQGWDTALRELHATYSDHVYLGYVNDLFKGKKLCTFPILSRSTYVALQQAFPVKYKGAFIDYHLLDVFMRLRKLGLDRLMYLEDVVFEHLHFRTGKSSVDATYLARDRFGDDEVFFELAKMRSDQTHALLALMGCPQEHEKSPLTGTMTAWPRRWYQVLPAMWRQFLANSKLPLKWRWFLFRWFTLRWIWVACFNTNSNT